MASARRHLQGPLGERLSSHLGKIVRISNPDPRGRRRREVRLAEGG